MFLFLPRCARFDPSYDASAVPLCLMPAMRADSPFACLRHASRHAATVACRFTADMHARFCLFFRSLLRQNVTLAPRAAFLLFHARVLPRRRRL